MLKRYPKLICESTIFEHRDGWNPIVSDLLRQINELGVDCTIHLTKNKWSVLRVVYTGLDEELFKLINRAEKRSKSTCEQCGGLARKYDTSGWYQRLCNTCSKQ